MPAWLPVCLKKSRSMSSRLDGTRRRLESGTRSVGHPSATSGGMERFVEMVYKGGLPRGRSSSNPNRKLPQREHISPSTAEF